MARSISAFGTFVLFGQRVSQNRQIPSVKEVENPVVHSAPANPKLVDAISQEIREWASQFMPELSKPFDSSHARLIGSVVGSAKLLEPIENWRITLVFLVEDDFRTRHRPSLTYHNIVIAAADGRSKAGERTMARNARTSLDCHNKTSMDSERPLTRVLVVDDEESQRTPLAVMIPLWG